MKEKMSSNTAHHFIYFPCVYGYCFSVRSGQYIVYLGKIDAFSYVRRLSVNNLLQEKNLRIPRHIQITIDVKQ